MTKPVLLTPESSVEVIRISCMLAFLIYPYVTTSIIVDHTLSIHNVIITIIRIIMTVKKHIIVNIKSLSMSIYYMSDNVKCHCILQSPICWPSPGWSSGKVVQCPL